MPTPLITDAELLSADPALSSTASGERTALIAAATAAINSACDRVLGTATYDEVFHPGRSRRIVPAQWPITGLTRIAADLRPVVTIRHTDASVLRATVSFTVTGAPGAEVFTGITLTAGGTATGLLFSSNTTAQALANAVNTVTGWSATVATGYGAWLTADLNATLGVVDAKHQDATLDAFARDLAYAIDGRGETARVIQLTEGFGDNFRFPDRSYGGGYGGDWGGGGGFGGGGGSSGRSGGVRVLYTAGYATADVPADLKRGAIAAAKFLLDRTTQGAGAYQSESIGAYSYTLAGGAEMAAGLPGWIVGLVDRYVRRELY